MSSYSLKNLNSFGLPSTCQHLFTLSSLDQLDELPPLLQSCDRVWLLSEGTNTIFFEDFEGLVIQMACKGIQVVEDYEAFRLHVQAGENWHDIVEFCLSKGMDGLENLALIPGSVGAAPIQNIGAYGSEFSKFCEYVDVLDLADGNVFRLAGDDCQFGYRDSIFKTEQALYWLILGVGICLPRLWTPNLSYSNFEELKFKKARQIFDHVVKTRSEKLPNYRELGNVGSFFKNPIINNDKFETLKKAYPAIVGFEAGKAQTKLAAAWLIEQAGGKKMSSGGAAVHENQALVMINKNEAVGPDVIALAKKIISAVDEKFNVQLQTEARLVGRYGEVSIEDAV